jgi:hypothetical protein
MSLRTLTRVSVVALLSLAALGIVTCTSNRAGPSGGAIRLNRFSPVHDSSYFPHVQAAVLVEFVGGAELHFP